MPTKDELTRYAEVILRVGLGDLKGRRLTVRAHVEAVALVRVLVQRAYELGSPRVDVVWVDTPVDITHATAGPPDAVEAEPGDAAMLNAAARRGDAFLRIVGGDFPYVEGEAGHRFSTIDAVWRSSVQELFERARADALPWAVAGYPTKAWAGQVFPGTDDGQDRLWAAIARVARLDADDPVAAWHDHVSALAARAAEITALDLVTLRYDAPGTSLTVGVEGRVWNGGSAKAFGNVPNIPTEEVFTSPHRDRVQGDLALTKPYVFAGEAIEDGVLTFEDGIVTAASCSAGQKALDRLLDTDEGSRRLGEVALVPHSSPVARERLQWHHPLYDENEDCHVALGMSYVFTAPGATGLDIEEQIALGLNHSRLHEDVVVGSDQLDVTGIDRHGAEHPLLVAGEWGFSVG